MKKIFATAAFAMIVCLGANAQKWQGLQDYSVPLVPVPVYENPDLALPDFEGEVKEPKADDETAQKSDAILNEDKDRKKRNKQ